MQQNGIVSDLIQFFANQNPDTLLLAVALLAVGFFMRRAIASLLLRTLGLVIKGFGTKLEGDMQTALQPAFQVATVSIFTLISVHLLRFPTGLEAVLIKFIQSFLVASVFSAIYDLLVPIGLVLFPIGGRSRTSIGREWIEKIGKIAILVLGVASVLDIWSIKLGSAMTGLGVFGAAIAFSTQDFIRNLVAGISNTSERRFKIGDWILMSNGQEGVVERIEMRSTLVRQFDQGAAFIPNSDLANAIVINFESRRHRQISWEVPLRQETTGQQLKQVRDAIEEFVRSSPDFLDTDEFPVRVRVATVSSEAMTILIYIYSKTAAYSEFLAVKERLVLAVIEAAEQAGAKFAYRGGSVFYDTDAPTANAEEIR